MEEIADWPKRRQAFELGPEVQELIQQLNRRLGFHSTKQLNFTQIFIMWARCRYKTGITFEKSGSEIGADGTWCAPFSVAHHVILEYYEDLRAFHSLGYGVRNRRLLENLSCGLIQDLMHHMLSENDTDTMARIFVTYLEEHHFVLVALGTFTDLWPLHEYNFAQQSGRSWSSSSMASFGSNISVVRYE